MYYEIYDTYNEGCKDERRNGLNRNASTRKVKVIRENGQYEQNKRVHDDNPETERKNDDGAEREREDRLKNPVQEREDERDKGKLVNVCA